MWWPAPLWWMAQSEMDTLLQLLPEGASVVAVIFTVVLFTRKGADDRRDFGEHLDRMQKQYLDSLRMLSDGFSSALQNSYHHQDTQTDRIVDAIKELKQEISQISRQR